MAQKRRPGFSDYEKAEIALRLDTLGIGIETIRSHMRAVYSKL